METLKTAQYLIKTNNTSISCGFNMFVYGDPRITYGDGYNDTYARIQGYEYAEEMAKKGEIAFTHNFNCDCGGYAFQYGGFWVCNDCGGKNVDSEWWKIKVEKDGNQFCCHGLDFINLQESDNVAFGDTFEDSIKNYGKLKAKIKS